MTRYDAKLSRAGLDVALPALAILPNKFREYAITIEIPEYSSVCPKTGLPDTGMVTIIYGPDKYLVELKSLKYYILGYRNLGIFYENAVNRILNDFVCAVKPRWIYIRGDFNPRGGIRCRVEATRGRVPSAWRP